MVSMENLFAVHALDAATICITGFNGAIIYTADSGKTWEYQKSNVETGLCDVSFVNAQTGWIAGRAGVILHTADGGKTWSKQKSSTSNHLFALCFVDGRNGWAAGDFGTIIHTGDGGATWEAQGSGEDKIYNDICFVDKDNGWVVGEFGLIYHTADGGKHWVRQECKDIIPVVDTATQWSTPTPSLYSVWFTDARRGWASGMDASLIATQDGGATWKKMKNPAEKNKVTLYRVVVKNSTCWAAGQKGTFLYSPDGMTWEDWSERINTKFWLMDMSFPDSLHGWAVGSRGTIMKTADGGESWSMLSGIPLKFK
jgi:photosystem II stability/assembly factor-like uncharacterized protein